MMDVSIIVLELVLIWTILKGSYCLYSCPSVCSCTLHSTFFSRDKNAEIIANCEKVNNTSLKEVLEVFDKSSLYPLLRNVVGLVFTKAIRHSNLTYIPHQMCSVSIKGKWQPIKMQISLDHNNIQNLSGNVLGLDKCNRVTYLDLSYNQIDYIEEDFFYIGVNLKTLNLSHNAMKTIFWLSPLKIMYVDFSFNPISVLEQRLIRKWLPLFEFEDIKQNKIINISNNKIDKMRNRDALLMYNLHDNQLPMTYGTFIVDLSQNVIQDITILGYILYYYARYKNSQNIRIVIDHNPIICDCRFYIFDRNVSKQLSISQRGKYYDYENVLCTNLDRIAIRDADFNITECTGKYCEDSKLCSCIHIPGRETLQVMCEGMAFTRLPNIINPELYESIELHLANNYIKELQNTPYMEKVTKLDLRNNLIQKWSSNIAGHFHKLKKLLLQNNKLQTLPSDIPTFCKDKSSGDAIIYVKNNPFLCDCTNRNLRTWLSQTAGCVADTKDLVCHGYFNKGLKFLGVPLSNFVCTWFNPLALAVALTVLALLTIVTLVLMYMFRKYVYLFLFTRFGIRLGYDNEMFGEGKEYDIFISYCNLDEDRANEVVRYLEEHNPPFRVCLHYRDFIPGDSVVDNIVRCIEISKCTLMLVSNNFVKSCWCNYEFKMAHHGAIEEKNTKLLVVLLENVDGAEADLNLYLKTNTYLERADPQFYPRLLMALPKPCGRRNSIGI